VTPKRGFIKPIAPDLKSVTQLAKYSHEPLLTGRPVQKGSVLNCPIGWRCESDNTQKLKAYKLDKDYTNTHPGTGAAMTPHRIRAY